MLCTHAIDVVCESKYRHNSQKLHIQYSPFSLCEIQLSSELSPRTSPPPLLPAASSASLASPSPQPPPAAAPCRPSLRGRVGARRGRREKGAIPLSARDHQPLLLLLLLLLLLVVVGQSRRLRGSDRTCRSSSSHCQKKRILPHCQRKKAASPPSFRRLRRPLMFAKSSLCEEEWRR